MFLSIVLPVYDVEKYIEGCLNSILPCCDDDCELILVTGASSDFSNEICRKYQNTHNNIIVVNQDGHGLSNARNCGMSIARGAYIAFWDSDDYIIPNHFRLLLKHIRSGCDADVYVSDFVGVIDSGEPLLTSSQIVQADAPAMNGNRLQALLAKKGNFWNVWRYVYARSFIQRHGFTFIEDRYAEDVLFSVQVLLHAERIAFFHNPYYCYRMYRAGSLMMAADPKKMPDTIESLSQSIQLSAKAAAFPYRDAMIKRLFREYMFIAAMLHEMPRRNRREAAAFYKQRLIKLYGLYGKAARPYYMLTRVAGVSILSAVMNTIKKVRRFWKKANVARTARARLTAGRVS